MIVILMANIIFFHESDCRGSTVIARPRLKSAVCGLYFTYDVNYFLCGCVAFFFLLFWPISITVPHVSTTTDHNTRTCNMHNKRTLVHLTLVEFSRWPRGAPRTSAHFGDRCYNLGTRFNLLTVHTWHTQHLIRSVGFSRKCWPALKNQLWKNRVPINVTAAAVDASHDWPSFARARWRGTNAARCCCFARHEKIKSELRHTHRPPAGPRVVHGIIICLGIRLSDERFGISRLRIHIYIHSLMWQRILYYYVVRWTSALGFIRKIVFPVFGRSGNTRV